MKPAAGQLRNGASSPLEPPVNQKLNAISWKMKKMAMVITMKVCRRTRSAISPNGTAISAPTAAQSGSSAKAVVPWMCQSRAAIASA